MLWNVWAGCKCAYVECSVVAMCAMFFRVAACRIQCCDCSQQCDLWQVLAAAFSKKCLVSSAVVNFSLCADNQSGSCDRASAEHGAIMLMQPNCMT